MSDQLAVAVVIAAFFAFMGISAAIQNRIDDNKDAAWRAGYEQGMKVRTHVK